MATVTRMANGDDEPEPRKKKKSKDRRSRPAVLWLVSASSGDEYKSGERSKLKYMPNPWPPSTIEILLICACTRAAAPPVIELIKAWIEERKARKIRIKNGEFEIEIQGGVSLRALRKTFDEFRSLTKTLKEDDIKIILPPGIDRTLPTKRVKREK